METNYTELDQFYTWFLLQQKPGTHPPDDGKTGFDNAALWLPEIEQEITERTVLDVACGDTYMRPFFTERGWVYSGIDLFDRGSGISVGDFHFMHPAPSALVFCSHALEHTMFPMFSLFKLFQFTMPGGYCMATVPQFPHGRVDPGHYCVLSDDAWKRQSREVGFRVLDSNVAKYGGDWMETRLLLKRDVSA